MSLDELLVSKIGQAFQIEKLSKNPKPGEPLTFSVIGEWFRLIINTAQIKQALADEGYVKTMFRNISFEELKSDPAYQHQMSGQEWYQKFINEIPELEIAKVNDDHICPDEVEKAAKRASGVSE